MYTERNSFVDRRLDQMVESVQWLCFAAFIFDGTHDDC